MRTRAAHIIAGQTHVKLAVVTYGKLFYYLFRLRAFAPKFHISDCSLISINFSKTRQETDISRNPLLNLSIGDIFIGSMTACRIAGSHL